MDPRLWGAPHVMEEYALRKRSLLLRISVGAVRGGRGRGCGQRTREATEESLVVSTDKPTIVGRKSRTGTYQAFRLFFRAVITATTIHSWPEKHFI